MAAFRKGLQELGWVEGQHYTIESRFAEGKIERFPGRAASLVQERVDVILPGSNPGALAAKHRTARTLNVTLPPSFLLRADQVIE